MKVDGIIVLLFKCLLVRIIVEISMLILVVIMVVLVFGFRFVVVNGKFFEFDR